MVGLHKQYTLDVYFPSTFGSIIACTLVDQSRDSYNLSKIMSKNNNNYV